MQAEYSDSDWVERMYKKSNSWNTKNQAGISLRIFDSFCKKELGVSKEGTVKQYQKWYDQNKSDIQSICISLDRFVQFMSQTHEDIIVGNGSHFKAKAPKTVKNYFGFIKNYLRIVHGIRITNEDVNEFIQFPTHLKEPREPISLKTLKILFDNASPKRRALYYILVSSGMRLGDGLSLKKNNFHLEENPVRVTLRAQFTKSREQRDTYISSEAFEKLKPILDSRSDEQYLFHDYERIDQAVKTETREFGYLRKRCGFTKRYDTSIRFHVNIHAFRSYFITRASQRHGSDYSHAVSGHHMYLGSVLSIGFCRQSKDVSGADARLVY